jgi:hypothetical protein
MWPVMLTRYSCLQRYILTMTTRPRSLFTKRADWSKHRDPTVQEWLKHFSAKEEEQKKKASVAYIPSPKARARTALILSWYRNGAVPWEVRLACQLEPYTFRTFWCQCASCIVPVNGVLSGSKLDCLYSRPPEGPNAHFSYIPVDQDGNVSPSDQWEAV